MNATVERSFFSGDVQMVLTESGTVGGPVFILVHGIGLGVPARGRAARRRSRGALHGN